MLLNKTKCQIRFVVCLYFLFAAIGCSEKQTEQEAKQQAASIKVMEIPLDSTLVDAKVLLTRNFYFIVDGSGSMSDDCENDEKFPDKLSGAKWAVEEFIKSVPADVNLGLYIFDTRGEREVLSLGPNNRELFLKAIQEMRANGGTPLPSAIRFGTDRLVRQYQAQLGYGEFRLVVVTDGLADGISEAAQYATERRVPIYTIGLCVEGNHPLRHWSVSYKAAESSEDLKKGLEEVVAEPPDFDPASFDSTYTK